MENQIFANDQSGGYADIGCDGDRRRPPEADSRKYDAGRAPPSMDPVQRSRNVRFEPDIMPQRIYGKPAALETKVKFTEPGDYLLRVIASDGELVTTVDVPVTVRR